MKTQTTDPVLRSLVRAYAVMAVLFLGAAITTAAASAQDTPAECQDAVAMAITACDLELIAPGSTDGVLR